MYNYKPIEKFIDKVVAEATEAAQKVFDKYNDELNERVKNQMGKDHSLRAGMGIVGVYNKTGDTIQDEFSNALTRTQYWNEVEAGFSLNDIN